MGTYTKAEGSNTDCRPASLFNASSASKLAGFWKTDVLPDSSSSTFISVGRAKTDCLVLRGIAENLEPWRTVVLRCWLLAFLKENSTIQIRFFYVFNAQKYFFVHFLRFWQISQCYDLRWRQISQLQFCIRTMENLRTHNDISSIDPLWFNLAKRLELTRLTISLPDSN